jgi:hypothetical protein
LVDCSVDGGTANDGTAAGVVKRRCVDKQRQTQTY